MVLAEDATRPAVPFFPRTGGVCGLGGGVWETYEAQPAGARDGDGIGKVRSVASFLDAWRLDEVWSDSGVSSLRWEGDRIHRARAP